MSMDGGPFTVADGRTGDAPPPDDCFYRFLRYGHVLRSLLREFLEEDFLRQVCPHRLTRSQFCVLKLVAANAELQVGELARTAFPDGVLIAGSDPRADGCAMCL